MSTLLNLFYTWPFLLQLVWGASDATYKAAVVDFAPLMSPPLTNFEVNLNSFKNFIVNASVEGADIIVFPEIGLTGYGPCSEEMYSVIPHPMNKIAPREDTTNTYSSALRELSSYANDNDIYVVVNLVEKEACEAEVTCPSEGRRIYNTNVVFDRNGTVIARYRKFNLFGEPDKSITTEPELSFFDTDFGVRFGVFTCFDLMFDRPALQLVKQLGISDIVFPTAWFSELPFLTAVQAQQMWAYTNDVNFLGSGYNKPLVGSGGSGIYAGRKGALTSIFQDTEDSQMLIQEVPKRSYKTIKPQFEELSKDISSMEESIPIRIIQLKKENMTAYVTVPLEDLNSNSTVCHGEFCCSFNATFKPNKLMPDEKIFYRAVVFNGVRTFDGLATGGIQACAIVSCYNGTWDGCGIRIDFPPIFTDISITGTFDAESSLIMPSTVKRNLLPLTPDEFTFIKSCDLKLCNTSMAIKSDTNDLLTFGVYSRVFSRDGEPVTEPSSANFMMSWLSIVISGLFCVFVLSNWSSL